jgi:hypothetical protein
MLAALVRRSQSASIDWVAAIAPGPLPSYVTGLAPASPGQLRLLRQRVVMTAQKAQADVLLHRLHYALPGWYAAAERRDAQDEFHSAAQARGRGRTATSMRTTALLSTAWAARLIKAGRAAPSGWRRRLYARP